MANLIQVCESEDNFQTVVIDGKQPVLVDFWAPWCGPCKTLTPIFEKVIQSYQGALIGMKVDIDAFEGLAVRYGIRGIPALFLFKPGEGLVGSKVGLLNEQAIKDFLNGYGVVLKV